MIRTNSVQSWPTLVDLLWSEESSSKLSVWIRRATLVITGSLLIAASAQVSIPFYPVPITGQTFGVLLVGLTFGWKLAGLTTLTYLLEGALGLPFFAGGAGGLAAFMSPSAGYLFGFVFGAMVCGYLAERGFDRTFLPVALALFLGHVIIFGFGLLWLGFYFGWNQPILTYGLWPFLPGAVIKTSLIVLALPFTWKAVDRIR